MKTPQLPRPALMKIGEKLRQYFETRVVESNPILDTLAIIADAKLRNDPYLKGSRHDPL